MTNATHSTTSVSAMENVIYRRIVRDLARRHMTLQSVTLSAIATLNKLQQ